MDYVIDPQHGHLKTVAITHIADKKAQRRKILKSGITLHVMLFQLVAGKDNCLLRFEAPQKIADKRLAEGACSAGDQDRFTIKIGNGVRKCLMNECHAINSKVIIRRDFPTLPHSG